MSSAFSGPKPGDRPDAAAYLPKDKSKLTGRPKGSGDKFHRTAKENIIAVFEDMGGTEAMVRWAKRNRTEFYKLYARLIPVNVQVRDMRDASELTDSELATIIAGGSRAGVAGEEAGEGISNGFH